MINQNTDKIIEYIVNEQKKLFLPSQLTFELTPNCNFNCPMCYIHQRNITYEKELLSTQQWINLAEQAYNAGVVFITFTGGEVFSRSDFRLIYETVYDMGFFPLILSNAFLIKDSDIEWLQKRKPFYFRSTLYGASDETYEKVCGVKNGFHTVTNNLLKMKKAGINIDICMTVIKDNYCDMDSVIEWARKNELICKCSSQIRGSDIRRGAIINSIRVLPEKLDFLDSIEHECDLYKYEIDKPFSCCRCYKKTAIINWQGRLKGCNFINSITVDATQGDLVEHFRNLWNELDTIHQPDKCKSCRLLQFCNPCPGALESESGDPEKISNSLCANALYKYQRCNLKIK